MVGGVLSLEFFIRFARHVEARSGQSAFGACHSQRVHTSGSGMDKAERGRKARTPECGHTIDPCSRT